MNTCVIHNGLLTDINSVKFLKENTPFRVALIGNLLRYKGVYEFLEAAKIIQLEGLQVEFYYVGDNIRKKNF